MKKLDVCLGLAIFLAVSLYFYLKSQESFTPKESCYASLDSDHRLISRNSPGLFHPGLFESKLTTDVDANRPLAGLEIIPKVKQAHKLTHPWEMTFHPKTGKPVYYNPYTGATQMTVPESPDEGCFRLCKK